jgi:hypothetical protein
VDDNMKERVLEQIEEQHLEPMPTWKFRLSAWLHRSAVALLFVLTALGLAGSVFILVENGTLEDLRLGPRWVRPTFSDFPWQLWLLVIVVGCLAFWFLRRTSRMYRVRRSVLIGALVLAVVLGAGAAYATSVARLTLRWGPGRALFFRGGNPMGNPYGGAVVGMLVVRTTDRWTVGGMMGETWLVIIQEDTYFPDGSDIDLGTIIRIVGPREGMTIRARGIRRVTGMEDFMGPGWPPMDMDPDMMSPGWQAPLDP